MDLRKLVLPFTLSFSNRYYYSPLGPYEDTGIIAYTQSRDFACQQQAYYNFESITDNNSYVEIRELTPEVIFLNDPRGWYDVSYIINVETGYNQ